MSPQTPSVPKLKSGVDITRFRLSMEEAFIASRIDGRASVHEIAAMVGKDDRETEKVLKRLADLGVVVLKSTVSVPPPKHVVVPEEDEAENEYEGFIFPPALMQEPGDLDEETRKRLIFTHETFRSASHYEVLQLERKTDLREIKKAYFDRSKEWHPDRFKRFKELGSFKRMIDEIFRQINDAYKLLSDGEKRKAYDATLPKEVDKDEIESLLKEQIQAEREERRADEKKRRRLKMNPILKRFGRAQEFYDAALALEKDGKLHEAVRAAQMAITYDDRKPDYQELYLRLQGLAAETKVDPLLKRGKHLLSMTNWEEAVEVLEEAAKLSPNNAEVRLALAYALVHKGDVEDAMPHAQKAVLLLPANAEAHYVLAWCYEGGNDKLAMKHHEKALELRPNYQEAKKRLKRLKWGF
jgi:curved DNA-binding protein CbpA